MKIFTLCLIVFTCNTFLIAQTKKTYNGDFENGTAVYQYYENKDFERIFDGSFTYTASINSIKNKTVGVENNNYWITGQFKDNLKSGPWQEKKTFLLDGNKNNYLTNIISGSYENGLRVGKWTYNSKGVKDSKTYEKITYYNFNKNILVGKIFSEGHIDGNIDNIGVFQGIWNVKTDGKEYIAEFLNGIFIKLIVRKIENGNILFKYAVSDFYNSTSDSTKLKSTLKRYNLSLKPEIRRFGSFAFGNKQTQEKNSNNDEDDDDGEKSKYEEFKNNLYDLMYFEEFLNYIVAFGSLPSKIEHGSSPTKTLIPYIIYFKDGEINADLQEN